MKQTITKKIIQECYRGNKQKKIGQIDEKVQRCINNFKGCWNASII